MERAALVLKGGPPGNFFSRRLGLFNGPGRTVSLCSQRFCRDVLCNELSVRADGQDPGLYDAGSGNRYYGLQQFRESGQFMDLRKMFLEYPYGRFPFDFQAYFHAATEHEIVVTDREDGLPRYS